jgi:REP element-mobilizing transposase RayT
METAPQPNRTHPHRLLPEEYQRLDQMVFVHFRCRDGHAIDTEAVAPKIAHAFADMASRFGITIDAYCLMPDHAHILVSVTEAGGDLAKWLRYAKRESARRLARPAMWQRSYWDRDLRRNDDIESAVMYLLDNPVRKNLCQHPFDWPFSWSRWHPETKGPAA